ncbi:MAG: hypothetical protein WAM04_12825 [Candidatus Sulfotelmatobacter sp.]
MMIAGVIAVALFGLYVWPSSRRHVLTEKEKEGFKDALHSQTEPPQTIQIACPNGDENTCVYAAQFIRLFGQAGWTVKGDVQRVTLAQPMAGIVLVERGGKKWTPDDWNSGGYTALTPSIHSIYSAFDNIDIQANTSAGPDLPDGQITVYFGTERPDESEPTELTRSMKKWPQLEEQIKNLEKQQHINDVKPR